MEWAQTNDPLFAFVNEYAVSEGYFAEDRLRARLFTPWWWTGPSGVNAAIFTPKWKWIGLEATTMECPHCRIAFHDEHRTDNLICDTDGEWVVEQRNCPDCHKAIFHLRLTQVEARTGGRPPVTVERKYFLAYPRRSLRKPPSKNVTPSLAEDYIEACLVLGDSPKSSAALGHRCLQQLFREQAGTTKKDLADQIEEVLASKQLPTHLSKAIDAVRHLGNIAAHTSKSVSTGEIVPVEPGEAEWTLDTLERLFDFYFDQPAILQERRDALDKKLTDLGKPKLKG